VRCRFVEAAQGEAPGPIAAVPILSIRAVARLRAGLGVGSCAHFLGKPPPTFPNRPKPAFPRPLPLGTLETPSYLILRGMSRPSIAALRLAASFCGKQPRGLEPPSSPRARRKSCFVFLSSNESGDPMVSSLVLRLLNYIYTLEGHAHVPHT
jgi:hypothetical protein